MLGGVAMRPAYGATVFRDFVDAQLCEADHPLGADPAPTNVSDQ